MRKLLMSILLGAVLMVPGCGPSGDVAAPEEEEAIEETAEDEEVTEEVAEEEPTEEEEPDIEEVAEEAPAEEEEEEEEPVEEVVVPKAVFRSSNLLIVHNTEVDSNSYTITVDVQNTGDLAGEYSLTPRVETNNMGNIKVSLQPGEKKTITLTEAQEYICRQARNYCTGTTSKRTYDITAGNCRETVEFPFQANVLQLISTYGVKYQDGYVELTGRVTNISEDSLEDVELVVINYDEDMKLLGEEGALIKRNPCGPGETSALYIVFYSPETKKYAVYFRFKGGDRIRTDYGEYEVYKPPED